MIELGNLVSQEESTQKIEILNQITKVIAEFEGRFGFTHGTSSPLFINDLKKILTRCDEDSSLKIDTSEQLKQAVEGAIYHFMCQPAFRETRTWKSVAKHLSDYIPTLPGFRKEVADPPQISEEDQDTIHTQANIYIKHYEHNALNHAIWEGASDAVIFELMKREEDRLKTNDTTYGPSPIEAAVRCGRINVLQALLKAGYRMESFLQDSNDTLHTAIHLEDMQTAKEMITWLIGAGYGTDDWLKKNQDTALLLDQTYDRVELEEHIKTEDTGRRLLFEFMKHARNNARKDGGKLVQQALQEYRHWLCVCEKKSTAPQNELRRTAHGLFVYKALHKAIQTKNIFVAAILINSELCQQESQLLEEKSPLVWREASNLAKNPNLYSITAIFHTLNGLLTLQCFQGQKLTKQLRGMLNAYRPGMLDTHDFLTKLQAIIEDVLNNTHQTVQSMSQAIKKSGLSTLLQNIATPKEEKQPLPAGSRETTIEQQVINYLTGLESQNSLETIILEQNTEVVVELVRQGFVSLDKSHHGKKPIEIAVQHQQVTILEDLLKTSAHRKSTLPGGDNALYMALQIDPTNQQACQKLPQILILLIGAGANKKLGNHYNQFPGSEAFISSELKLRGLLSSFIRTNEQNEDFEHALTTYLNALNEAKGTDEEKRLRLVAHRTFVRRALYKAILKGKPQVAAVFMQLLNTLDNQRNIYSENKNEVPDPSVITHQFYQEVSKKWPSTFQAAMHLSCFQKLNKVKRYAATVLRISESTHFLHPAKRLKKLLKALNAGVISENDFLNRSKELFKKISSQHQGEEEDHIVLSHVPEASQKLFKSIMTRMKKVIQIYQNDRAGSFFTSSQSSIFVAQLDEILDRCHNDPYMNTPNKLRQAISGAIRQFMSFDYEQTHTYVFITMYLSDFIPQSKPAVMHAKMHDMEEEKADDRMNGLGISSEIEEWAMQYIRLYQDRALSVAISELSDKDPKHLAIFRTIAKQNDSLDPTRTGNGKVPMTMAVDYGKSGFVKVLAEANPVDLSQDTPDNHENYRLAFLRAVETGQVESVRALLSAGVLQILSRFKQNTPLHIAVQLGGKTASDMVCLLMTAGFTTEVKDQYGRTPIDIAQLHGRLDLVKIMEEKAPAKQKPSTPNLPLKLMLTADFSPTHQRVAAKPRHAQQIVSQQDNQKKCSN